MLLEVTNKNNKPGFEAFDMHMEVERKKDLMLDKTFVCLFIKNDSNSLQAIKQELGKKCLFHTRQRELLESLIVERSMSPGYILKTKDQEMMEIMVDYINSKLEFTQEQTDAIQKLMPEAEIKNDKKDGCILM